MAQQSLEMQTPTPTNPESSKRYVVRAFLVGAVIHSVLLASSLSGVSDFTTYLLLLFAFPGALVDISSEMIHPSRLEGILIATFASAVNGAAYALGAWFVLKIRKRCKGT